MHILIAPDKFKDALSAQQAAEAMAKGLKQALPEATYTLLPLADGGEGTASLLTRLKKGKCYTSRVANPIGTDMPAGWGYQTAAQQAYIELAAASGLELLPPEERNPLYTTTRGTGELIAAALEKGARSLILGLGGSATNDGGTGMAAALGYRFLDKWGKPLPFLSAQQLSRIRRISMEAIHPRLSLCAIVAACDVNNPLLGPSGASYTFAPQKGAKPADLPRLEEGLHHLAELIKQDLGKEVTSLAGSGAAGGAGAGVLAFLNGRLANGTELMLEQTGFPAHLSKADMLLTGEGRFDSSSLEGKVIGTLCRMAGKEDKPVVAFCGSIDQSLHEQLPASMKELVNISEKEPNLQAALQHTAENLQRAVYEYLKKTYAP